MRSSEKGNPKERGSVQWWMLTPSLGISCTEFVQVKHLPMMMDCTLRAEGILCDVSVDVGVE